MNETPEQIPGLTSPHRLCHYCGFHRDVSNFPGARSKRCLDCRRRYKAQWQKDHAQEHLESGRRHSARRLSSDPQVAARKSREFRERHPRSVLSSRLKARYGISADEYDRIAAEQGGVCAICLYACADRERLSVDHDHATGKVRGLLCNSCNVSIGRFKDNPALLKAAAAYIMKFRH